MKVIGQTEKSDIATVYVAESRGRKLEFVESVQPPKPLSEKWVLIVSTLFGCPVNCKFCDAGGDYSGKANLDELAFQIDYPISKRFPDGFVNTDYFKVQFARMGDPAFNPAVLDLLREFPDRYGYRRFAPSLSTIAPAGREYFFEELLDIKEKLYRKDFQMQFSIHSTDAAQRDFLMPAKKMSFAEIAEYSERFFDPGGKKISLNFALAKDSVVDSNVLLERFSPEIFILKITPLNPTRKAEKHGLQSLISENNPNPKIIDELRKAGYDVILSVGEYEENKIGSNCGQYVNSLANGSIDRERAYCYDLETV